jgi:integrase
VKWLGRTLGTIEGRENVTQMLRGFIGALPDLHAAEQDIVANGNSVVVRYIVEATHHGKLLGLAPTGRRVRWDAVDAVVCGALEGADNEAANRKTHGVQLHPRRRPVAGKSAPRSHQPDSVDSHAGPGVRRRCRSGDRRRLVRQPEKGHKRNPRQAIQATQQVGVSVCFARVLLRPSGVGLAEIRFDVRRAFRLPEPIRRLSGPDPRNIDQIFWAKLLQPGQSLTDEDVLSTGHNYPAAMVRAVAIVWLFCGIRRDEIRRLRVGCVQRQTSDMGVPASNDVLTKDSVVFLNVPPNKTTPAFNKPVDTVVAELVEAWEQLRPTQPPMLDAKAAEMVQYLFAHRGRLLGMAFLNATLIPLLCRKAGVPEADARGKLTSHRARSTIASMLGNAKEPMTLLELQQWLGHRWPSSTQHYFQILPTKLGRAYADADYFRRNVRTVDVLIDEQTILSGAAANGEPWKYFDLGHGLCANPFYEQCPHRLACARCPFYRPKPSTLEANAEAITHLRQMTKMQQTLTLTDDELVALSEGADLLQALVDKLRDVPTPGGPTPRELENPAQ